MAPDRLSYICVYSAVQKENKKTATMKELDGCYRVTAATEIWV